MIEIILKNIAYLYFPKGICSMNDYDKYIKSNEFKNLNSNLKKQISDENFQSSKTALLNTLKNYESFKDIRDITIELQDRCLTFETEIIKGSKLIKICLNISLLIPYYFIYVLKNDIEVQPKHKWLNLPNRDKKSEFKFRKEIKLLEKIVEHQIIFNRFPNFLVDMIIPEINYVDIELGKFTYYNAFFLDYINL